MTKFPRRMKLAAVALLFLVTVAVVIGLRSARRPDGPPLPRETNPHEASAVHPPEVARIMALLPTLPADAPFEQIIDHLGLPRDCDGGEGSSTHCTMTWNVSPGYVLAINFDPFREDGRPGMKFTEASFSAPNKPGFAPHEHHTIYPYRSWEGMVYK